MKETDPEFESADAVMTVNEAENGKMVVSEAGEVFGVSERQGHPGSAFFSLRIVVRAFRQKIVFSAILVENLKIQKALIRIIYAIMWENLAVLIMAHPIIPLSREKLFKEKSIDRATAFFE